VLGGGGGGGGGGGREADPIPRADWLVDGRKEDFIVWEEEEDLKEITGRRSQRGGMTHQDRAGNKQHFGRNSSRPNQTYDRQR